jgi:hypothetical protein
MIEQKRAQITLFTIIFVVVLITILFFGFFYSTKKEIITKKPDIKDIVIKYAETCLKMVTENGTFNRLGYQGAYISVDGSEYEDSGIPDGSPAPTKEEGHSVPYYLKAICNPNPNCCLQPCDEGCCGWGCDWEYDTYLPDETEDLSIIAEKLENYIKVEFNNCFKTNIFKDIGINVTKPSDTDVNVEVTLNEEDMTAEVIYPLKIEKEGIKADVDVFRVTIPIRLKALYESAKDFVKNIEEETSGCVAETDAAPYTITPDCDSYNKNGLTNVFVKVSDNGEKEIVQFMDYSIFGQGYVRGSYIFQFAIKNVNVKDGPSPFMTGCAE